jgi:hypothetical protein
VGMDKLQLWLKPSARSTTTMADWRAPAQLLGHTNKPCGAKDCTLLGGACSPPHACNFARALATAALSCNPQQPHPTHHKPSHWGHRARALAARPGLPRARLPRRSTHSRLALAVRKIGGLVGARGEEGRWTDGLLVCIGRSVQSLYKMDLVAF